MIPKVYIQDHIYIFNSYICIFDWGKMENRKKIRFEWACPRKLYM